MYTALYHNAPFSSTIPHLFHSFVEFCNTSSLNAHKKRDPALARDPADMHFSSVSCKFRRQPIQRPNGFISLLPDALTQISRRRAGNAISGQRAQQDQHQHKRGKTNLMSYSVLPSVNLKAHLFHLLGINSFASIFKSESMCYNKGNNCQIRLSANRFRFHYKYIRRRYT